MLANATFAVIQILLGVGIAWPRTLRLALAASVFWSLAVWWIGEGLGGVLSGEANPLSGAPGAALMYAIIAVVIWPSDSASTTPPFLAARPIGARPAMGVWLGLWGCLACFALIGSNRSPEGMHDMLRSTTPGEPGSLVTLSRHAASLVASHGLMLAIALAVLLGLVAVSVALPIRWARIGIAVAVTLSVLSWVVSQDLGGLFTGGATDPNSGPLLVLVALAYWPNRQPGTEAASSPGRPTTSPRLRPE